MHRLLCNYLSDSEELLDQIDHAIKHKHYGALRDHCHALKGNSLGVGARDVFARAEIMDRAEMGELRLHGATMAASLRRDYVVARAAIEDYLVRRQAASR